MKSFAEAEWPIDILHVSDVHFTDLPVIRAEREEAWARLVADVAQLVADGAFRPRVIACTGDLVDDPWRPTFRRSVTALLQLARACGFVDEEARWEEGSAEAPEAWRQLLYDRIFLVPGNHDLYPTGLRFLWNPKATAEWLEVAGVHGWKPEKKARLEPQPSKVIGPLAVLMIDSNGSSAWWKSARGTVAHQIDLSWNPEDEVDDRHFRVALVHAHPLQVPFFLDGVFDQEASLGMENAGFLLKNLADLGVQLILHGHRHYPCLYTLRLQDSHGQPKTIVIAGAGSATKAPGKWPYCSYNWIRVFPDRRVEVTILRREPHSPTFTRQLDAFSATTGDFVCDDIVRHVQVHGDFGDIEVHTRVAGLRVLPGAPPVSRLPLELLALPAAAWYARLTTPSGERKHTVWHPGTGTLEVQPPLTPRDGECDLDLSFHVHGAVACNRWEALQLGQKKGSTPLDFRMPFPARTARFEFDLPIVPAPPTIQARWRDPVQGSKTLGPGGRASGSRLVYEVEYPVPSGRTEVDWDTEKAADLESKNHRAVLNLRLLLGQWQDTLYDQMTGSHGPRPLDGLCAELVDAFVRQLGVLAPDLAFYVPAPRSEAADLPKARTTPQGNLYLAGACFHSCRPPDRWVVPFSEGVEGRAYRSASLTLFHVTAAEQSVAAYRETGRGRPENFHRPLPGTNHVVSVAAPIFPAQVAERIKAQHHIDLDVNRPDLTLLVFSLGSAKVQAFMDLPNTELARLFRPLLEELESKLWRLIQIAHATPNDEP